MNTRTYPRTLNEAFPRTPEYANAIERPARPFDWQDKVVMCGCAVAFTAFLAIVFLWG